MRRTLQTSIAVLMFAIGCGGSSSSGPTGTTTIGNGNTMSATIDGKAWSSPTPSGTYKNNIVSIAGIDLGITSAVSLASGVTGPGSYSLGVGNQLAGSAIVTKGGQGWASALQGGSGTLVFTTLTANHVVGTFSFTAVAASGGATGTVSVTNGKFDITF